MFSRQACAGAHHVSQLVEGTRGHDAHLTPRARLRTRTRPIEGIGCARSARLDLNLDPPPQESASATATFESRRGEPQARWQALRPFQDADDAGFRPDVRSFGIAELLHSVLHGIAATHGNSLVLLDSVLQYQSAKCNSVGHKCFVNFLYTDCGW